MIINPENQTTNPKVANDNAYIGYAKFRGGGFIVVGVYDDEQECHKMCGKFAEDYDARATRENIMNPKRPPPVLESFDIYVCSRNKPFELWGLVFEKP